MNRRRLILAMLLLLSAGLGTIVRTPETVDVPARLREIAPSLAFAGPSGQPPLYRAMTGEVAFDSSDLVPSIRGYAGPLRTLVVLGPDGRIRGLRILFHRETRNYVHYLETPAYLSTYIGKSVHDRFEVDRDVDGISRATVSVEALARTVRDASRIAADRTYGIRSADTPGRGGERGWMLYAALLLVAATVYARSRTNGGMQRVRDGVLAASILITGIILSTPFSLLHVLNLVLLRPSTSVLWSVIVGSTLVSIVAAGRFYCGWLCPFGALAELVGRLPFRSWSVPPGQEARWREVKYVLLGAAATAVMATGRVEYGNYEVYVTLFSLHGSLPAWLLTAAALPVNIRIRRFWCRALCPVAALAGLLSRQDPSYVSCGDCPMENGPQPETAECIRCNRCRKPSNTRQAA